MSLRLISTPIAIGLLAPTVSSAPSFLALPPEIRNTVYELILKAHSDIKIICSEYGTPRPLLVDNEVRAQFRSGLSLLSTCRQIYNEAVTTMMSSNTWTVMRDIHNMHFHAGMVEQADGAARWMLCLGSQINMLTEVRLDLDQSCPIDCHEGHGSTMDYLIFFDARYAVHFGSLVKLLWVNPGLLLNVKFVHPHDQQHRDRHPGNDPLQRQTGLQVSLLNTLLSTFSQDPLQIKKYSC